MGKSGPFLLFIAVHRPLQSLVVPDNHHFIILLTPTQVLGHGTAAAGVK